MYFSLDTNILIGIVNDRDTLHTKSIELVTKKDESWIISHSALTEAKITLRGKLSQAVAKTFPILLEIKECGDSLERNEKLISYFRDLIDEESKLKNFYRLLYSKILSYLNIKGFLGLPSYISELGENMARILEVELRKYIDFKEIRIEEKDMDLFSDIRKEISSIRFKDSNDADIFYELVVNLKIYNPVEFYTDDDEFEKKGKRAYSLLTKNMDYKNAWFKIIHI